MRKATLKRHDVKGNLPEMTGQRRAEIESLAAALVNEYGQKKLFYKRVFENRPSEQEHYTLEKIEDFATHATFDSEVERLMSAPAQKITFDDLNGLLNRDPVIALQVWEAVRTVAEREVKNGGLSVDALHIHRPYERAEYMAIREAFIEEWKPRGGIECSLIEMLAQSYCQWNHWLKVAAGTGNYEYMFEDPNIKQNFEEYWSTPRMQTADWIEHAIMMADRFNRIFLRTLRQMRDLRRYSVTINNPQQVNIAAEGGQQVNAVKVENSKKLKARNGKRH